MSSRLHVYACTHSLVHAFARVRVVAVSAAIATLLAATAATAGAAVTISPLRGSTGAMPGTQVSFLGAPASGLRSIRVVGSASGRHSGRLRSYASATGASFIPRTAFTPGEHVSVSARLRVGRRTVRLATSFSVAQPATIPLAEFTAGPSKASDAQSFLSEPALHPPVVTIHRPATSASAPGYLIATPFIGPGQYGPMIFDNAGSLVWFRPLPNGEDAADFRTQVYRGQNDLTWWQGRTLNFGFGLGSE